jgi:hypothetical protein
MRTKFCLMLSVAFLVCLGCEPTDVPRISPDGKHAALLLPPAEAGGPKAVGIVRLDDGTLARHTPPEGFTATGVVWAGNDLLVNLVAQARDPKAEGQGPWLFWTLRLADGTFSKSSVPSHITLAPFVGVYKGEPALYAPEMDSDRTKIFSLPGLKELGALEFPAAGAGDGWYVRIVEGIVDRQLIPGGKEADWIRESLPEDARTRKSKEMIAVEVYNPQGGKVATLERDEIAKASYRGPRSPICTRISPDGKRLLLGFGTDTIFRQHTHEYTFGVFDLEGAKLLWQGSSNNLWGFPVFTGDAMFALEAKSREIYTGEKGPGGMLAPPPATSQPTAEVVLARHTEKGRDVILDVPLEKQEKAARYSYSPDRKMFVLQAEGAAPRLLLIPVSDKATAKDVRAIPLGKGAETP